MYILTRRSLNKTARILARELRLEKSYEPRREPPAIRWGNSDGEYAGEPVYQNRGLILACANKGRFSGAMTNLNIPHVELLRETPEKFPIVIRGTLTGARGAGISICKSMEEYSVYQTPFWTPWYKFKYELGVHIFNGRVLKVFRKEWDREEDEEEFPIKNANRGYHFSVVKIESFKSLIPFVENFYNKFGLRFGRLDIGWDVVNKTYRIIEANSAPGLADNKNTLELYLECFRKELN